MIEDNKSQITYDDGWKDISNPEYVQTTEETDCPAENECDNTKAEISKKKNAARQYLAMLQLAICAAIALAAFLLKCIGGETYENVRNWYYTNLEKSIIFDSDEEFDINDIFSVSTSDEL